MGTTRPVTRRRFPCRWRTATSGSSRAKILPASGTTRSRGRPRRRARSGAGGGAAPGCACLASARHPQTFPVQVANGNFGIVAGENFASVGHNPVAGAAAAAFPFGGFARNGDVLHVPFIGAYRLLADVGGVPTLLEINPITMDA